MLWLMSEVSFQEKPNFDKPIANNFVLIKKISSLWRYSLQLGLYKYFKISVRMKFKEREREREMEGERERGLSNRI